MHKLYLFPVLALVLFSSQGYGQTLFLDEGFGVSAPETMVYGQNYNVIAGNTITPLPMDVYTPTGDTSRNLRPVAVMFHTGNFLPQYFNGGPYGNRKDSVNVEMLSRFVRKGFVGISADYRLGWQPTAEDQTVRTETLLKAVYRASQDAHALARYLRKSVAEDGNPMQIDTSKIMFLGVGSGGYLVNAFNYLDSIEQIEQNINFLDSEFNSLIDTAIMSNPQGTIAATQHVVNSPGYRSDVALVVNIAGALGDTLWMNGDEAPTISIHSATDPFAPYYSGLVIVPTNPPRNVVTVQGSRLMEELANDMGINDTIQPGTSLALPDIFDPLSSLVNRIIAGYSQIPFTSPISTNTNDTFPLGEQNLWTVLRTSPPQIGASGATTGVWNWFNEDDLRSDVDALNAASPGANVRADTIIAGEAQTNPNYDDPERAKANIDTMMAFIMPRAYYALNLETVNISTATEDLITNASVALQIFPNPGTTGFTIQVANTERIRQIDMYDLRGSRVAQVKGINQSSYVLDRGDLPNGTYIIQLRFDAGTTARKVFLR